MICRVVSIGLVLLSASCAHHSNARPTSPRENIGLLENLPRPTTTRPVVAAIGIDSLQLSPGESGTLHVVVRIADGWHIYPLDHPGPEVPTQFSTELPEGFSPDGEWILADAADDSEYSGDLRFKRSIRVSASASLGQRLISSRMKYQACDIASCRPPETIELQTSFVVVESN